MICGFLLFAAGVTTAPTFDSSHLGHLKPSIVAMVSQYEAKAKALKDEMAALQKSDQGQLTPEHRAYLQASASALIASYRQQLAKMDPLSINADGTPRY